MSMPYNCAVHITEKGKIIHKRFIDKRDIMKPLCWHLLSKTVVGENESFSRTHETHKQTANCTLGHIGEETWTRRDVHRNISTCILFISLH